MNKNDDNFKKYSYSWTQAMSLQDQWMHLAQSMLVIVELEELAELDSTIKGDDHPWAYNAIMESYHKFKVQH